MKSKIITKKEIDKLTPVQRSGRAKSGFRAECYKLNVGEVFLIDKGEWLKAGYSAKTKPYNILPERNGKIKFKVVGYAEGFAVERLK